MNVATARRHEYKNQPGRRSATSMNVATARLRIIGGQWRNRKLMFKSYFPIRPTPDRVRETLFNWLQPYLANARCLELFAGSGALSFEALSRGAASAVAVDNQAVVCAQIRAEANRFAAKNITVHAMDAERFVRESDMNYDIIFLDPPFAQGLMGKITSLLSPVLRGHTTLIYMEMGRDEPFGLPNNWLCLHNKRTREIRYSLVAAHGSYQGEHLL